MRSSLPLNWNFIALPVAFRCPEFLGHGSARVAIVEAAVLTLIVQPCRLLMRSAFLGTARLSRKFCSPRLRWLKVDSRGQSEQHRKAKLRHTSIVQLLLERRNGSVLLSDLGRTTQSRQGSSQRQSHAVSAPLTAVGRNCDAHSRVSVCCVCVVAVCVFFCSQCACLLQWFLGACG